MRGSALVKLFSFLDYSHQKWTDDANRKDLECFRSSKNQIQQTKRRFCRSFDTRFHVFNSTEQSSTNVFTVIQTADDNTGQINRFDQRAEKSPWKKNHSARFRMFNAAKTSRSVDRFNSLSIHLEHRENSIDTIYLNKTSLKDVHHREFRPRFATIDKSFEPKRESFLLRLRFSFSKGRGIFSRKICERKHELFFFDENRKRNEPDLFARNFCRRFG